MKKKRTEITLAMILAIGVLTCFLTGCGEYTEGNGTEEVQITETETLREDEPMPENRLDVEMSQNYGRMFSVLSQLDEVTYP